jgi:outer membrane protein OmpA-like peptidoglycan-associated protein
VRPKCLEKIRIVAAWARQHSDEHLVLTGYLDVREADVEERALAQRRVRAVRDALVSAGVERSRIEADATAGFAPACIGSSERCQELNRRVEIKPAGADAATATLIGPTPGVVTR